MGLGFGGVRVCKGGEWGGGGGRGSATIQWLLPGFDRPSTLNPSSPLK